MKITSPIDLSNIMSLNDLVRFVSQFARQVATVINGQISVTDNLNVQILNINFTLPNKSQPISHALGRTPSGYIVCRSSANMVVFDGNSQNTADTIYLQSSATGMASVLVF